MKFLRSYIKYLTILAFLSCLFKKVFSQDHFARYNSIDVMHYSFNIELSDSSNEIKGNAFVILSFKTVLDSFYLDLININKEGKGMVIDKIWENNKTVNFMHQNNRITIFIDKTKKDEKRIYNINYHGIPIDGLIIAKNKFGDRVFFGDNWPNRARHWLPTVDHPSDKASVEFIVKAPSHYQVIANGLNKEVINTGEEIISHWQTNILLPTKIMVIGVARFARQNLTRGDCIPLSTWVYPQNKNDGFNDYSITSKPLDYFIAHIAPYPFSKLANVQSKTIYGGMENASCIFYAENTVTGKQNNELLFAHEVAHQWFGNSVSELNWYHIWLSEGFATYFTDLYVEHYYGKSEFTKRMKYERNEVLEYSKKNLSPVSVTTVKNLTELINTNSYKKAGWFLHMLRKELGDTLFWQSIQSFYQKFKYSNAITEDFQAVVESLSGKNYQKFFHQWLYQSGHPILSAKWSYENHEIKLIVKQHQQQYIFMFPLEIKIIYADNSSSFKKFNVNNSENIFTIQSGKKPREIVLDPDTWLLFEESSLTK